MENLIAEQGSGKGITTMQTLTLDNAILTIAGLPKGTKVELTSSCFYSGQDGEKNATWTTNREEALSWLKKYSKTF